MGATVLVSVYDGTELLDTRSCRSVVLPDGTPGVVWRGLAYPLRPDDRVEVTDPALPPSACRRAAPAPSHIAHALIEGVEEAWLVVAGSVADRDLVANKLKEGGIAVLRTGPWMGDPVEGFAADWFVRFARPVGDEPLLDVVNSLIGTPAAPTNPSDLRLRLVEAELASARAREARLRHDLARVKNDSVAAAPGPGTEIAALRDELAAERALRESAEVAARDANAALMEAAARADMLRTATEPIRPVQPAGAGRRIADEVATVLSTLLPGVRLLRNGLTVVSAEFRERGSLYRTLAELQPPPARLPSSWKKLQGADGWWERHVSTGEDDAGRAYARWDGTDRHWDVLVSHKGDQVRDIAWLRHQ